MRRSTRKLLPRHLTFLLLLVALGALRYLDRNPIELRAGDPSAHGSPMLKRHLADVLVLVDSEVVAASRRHGTFDRVDWSYGWVNLVAQEIGRYAVLGPGEIQLDALEGRRVVIVTRSAVRAAELWLPQIKLFVEDGGVLVLEWPTNRWDLLSGAEVARRGELPLSELTGIRMPQVMELTELPWETRFIPLKVVRSEVEVLAESQGYPVVLRRRLGKGWVLTLAMDVGRQITVLQQGKPDPGGLTLSDRYARYLDPGLHTDDMVAAPRLITAHAPYADVFERFVMALVDETGPIPKWWRFPDAYLGAFLMTFDEDGLGPPAGWMPELFQAKGSSATCFVGMGEPITTSTPGFESCDLGLAWNLLTGPRGLSELLGVWRVRPIRRQISLKEQAGWFQRSFRRAPRVSRSVDLAWERSWVGPFQKLAAQGIELDSSLGPHSERGHGYLFGTGLPFRVLDDNGMPLGLMELPFLMGPGTEAPQRTLARLLRDSRELYHEAVTVRLSAREFQDEPSVDTYRLVVSSMATSRDQWITTLEDYLGFIQAREQGVLTSTFDGELMTITVQTPQRGLTIALPAQWSGRPAGAMSVDGVGVTALTTRGVGGDILLLPLERGTHSVVVEYPEAR